MSAYSYISTNVDLDSAIGYQTVVANSPGQVFVDVAAGQNFVAGPTSATPNQRHIPSHDQQFLEPRGHRD